MRRNILLTLITATVLCLSAADRAREIQLQQALDLMQTKGDLSGAIKLLEEVGKSPDRNLAARSLLHLGDCRLKLGQQEASKPFERVLREFSDQREIVVEAQTRLAALRQPVSKPDGIVTRQVWTGPKVDEAEGNVSADGRYMSFPDWGTSELGLHDFVTGKDRLLTAKESSPPITEYAEQTAISRDGKQVAFGWFNGKSYELRLVDTTGGPGRKPRLLLANPDVTWVGPYDWSPDGKSVLMQLTRADRTKQMAIVSVPRGELRVLKSLSWRADPNMRFSPDGKYIAYDLPASDESSQRDIFLMATDASRDAPILVHSADETVIGWTPDGKHLLFTSDRGGTRGLWALRIEDGKAQNAPVLLKPDIGYAHGLGMTGSGTLYLGVAVGGVDIHIASIDMQTGRQLSPVAKPIQQFVGTNSMPAFSRDGKYLAYQSLRGGPTRLLYIRSLETGHVRELRPEMGYISQPDWSPDGRSLAVRGSDNKGRSGLFRIDTETGAVSLLVLVDRNGGANRPQWSSDGGKLYYLRMDGESNAVVVRDLSTGNEREIVRRKQINQPRLSPDGRLVVLSSNNRRSLLTVSVDGGEPREIVALPEKESFQQLEWAPDGQAVIASKVGPGGFPSGVEIVRVPLQGGPPQKLDLGSNNEFSIHPDGQRIAFTSGQIAREVWAIDNILPMLQRGH